MESIFFDVDKEMSWYFEEPRKNRISVTHRPHKGKKVHQYTLDGKFVKEWISQRHASRSLGNDVHAVGKVLRGKQLTAFGFKWQYAE